MYEYVDSKREILVLKVLAVVFLVGAAAYYLFYHRSLSDVDPNRVLNSLQQQEHLRDRVTILESHNGQVTSAIDHLIERGENSSDEFKIYDAIALLETGDTSAAEGFLNKSFARQRLGGRSDDCEAAGIRRHLGAMMALHDIDSAIRSYRDAVSLDPANPEGWMTLGYLQFDIDQLDAAEAAFGRVIELGPKVSGKRLMALAHDNLAEISRRHGQLSQATNHDELASKLREMMASELTEASRYNDLESHDLMTRVADHMEKFRDSVSGKGPEIVLDGKEGYAEALLYAGFWLKMEDHVLDGCTIERQAKAVFSELGNTEKVKSANSSLLLACCSN